MRLAVVTPLKAEATGVADYSLDLLPYLAEAAHGEVDVYGEENPPEAQAEARGWSFRPIADLADAAPRYDLIIYQMGNSPAHDFMAPYLFRYPGLVVLHDISLHNFFARQATRAGDIATYLRAFGFACGVEGAALARRYLRQPMPIGYPEYLVSEWLAARSPGVIVHSQHAAAILGERCPSARIWAVPMPMPAPVPVSPGDARVQLGVKPDVFLVIVFGMLNLGKHPIEILEAVELLLARGIPARAVFIGRENDAFSLSAEVERRGLEKSVTHLGFADAAIARLWMFAADAGINLRRLYFGETSASALRVMATGTPCIVSNVGAFSELPDSACLKIPFDAPDVARLLGDALEKLYAEPERRLAMGTSARDEVDRVHAPGQVAQDYRRAAESVRVSL